jgi:hypothetical protein
MRRHRRAITSTVGSLTATGYANNGPGCPASLNRGVLVGRPGSGCDNASTVWTGGSGWWRRTILAVPTGEATPQFVGWDGQASKWNTALLPLSFNFGGRRVQEAIWKPGSDTCYFSGSAVDPFTQVTGGTWDAANDGTNVYGPDEIGPSPKAVYYYRVHKKTDCGSTIYQAMLISCDGPWNTCLPSYVNNTLSFTIGATTITSSRASAPAVAETWGPSQGQFLAITITISVSCLMGLLCAL